MDVATAARICSHALVVVGQQETRARPHEQKNVAVPAPHAVNRAGDERLREEPFELEVGAILGAADQFPRVGGQRQAGQFPPRFEVDQKTAFRAQVRRSARGNRRGREIGQVGAQRRGAAVFVEIDAGRREVVEALERDVELAREKFVGVGEENGPGHRRSQQEHRQPEPEENPPEDAAHRAPRGAHRDQASVAVGDFSLRRGYGCVHKDNLLRE